MRLAILGVLGVALMLPTTATAQSQIVPVQMDYHDGVTGLKRWTRSPVLHSDNRIVPRGPMSRGVRVLSVVSPLTEFLPALEDCLSQDGLSDIEITSVTPHKGEAVEAYRVASQRLGAEFYTWVARATGEFGPVISSGFATVSATDEEFGTRVDMMVAPQFAYVDFGGWAVPAVRYLGAKLEDPRQNMRALGAMSDAMASTALAGYWTEWMVSASTGEDMATIGSPDALGIDLELPGPVEETTPELPAIGTSN